MNLLKILCALVLSIQLAEACVCSCTDSVVPPVVCPAPEPVPVEIKGFNVLPIDDQTIKVSIASIPVGAAKIKITSVSTLGRESGPKVGPNPEFPASTVWPQNIAGFHPGWQIDIQALAIDTTGKEMVKSPSVTVTMPGDPAAIWPPVSNPPTPTPIPVPPSGTQGTVFDAKVLGIAAAISSSKAGDTILFPAGTYALSNSVTLLGGRLYLGQGSAIISGKGPNGHAFYINQADTKVVGLTFTGGGIFSDASGPTNLVLDNNIFDLNTSCSAQPCRKDAIQVTSRYRNARITNNLFRNFKSGFAIMSYAGYDGLNLSNNELVNIALGFHVDGGGTGLLVEQNYMVGIAGGPGMEFQSAAIGAIFQDNVFEHPVLVSNKGCSVQPNNCYSYAYSLPLNNSKDVMIRRNKVIAPERPDGVGCRIGFETGGTNMIVEQNYIDGINSSVDDTDGATTSGSVIVRNNYINNALSMPHADFPGAGRTFTATNNGPNVKLNWDVNRPNPGRNKRY